jgi:prepilin-type N-terminal cleavage/methylation domain-containing protein
MKRRAGFTIMEVAIALVLVAVVSIKVALLLDMASTSETEDAAEMALEDQTRRVLDQIAFAVMGANRETLFPDPESPTYSEEVQYEVSIGVEDGEVVWGDPEQIGLEDGNDTRVLWLQNPGELEERRVVWCNVVRPFLEGEVMNGVDDNGNGLVDEKGLNFTLQGNMVAIRLSLERVRTGGEVITNTVETQVTLRN